MDQPEGKIELRDEASDLGGTMRLGGQVCRLAAGTRAREAYGDDEIVERHRHRFEVNNQFVEALEKAGLVVSGKSVDGSLVEMIELPDHPGTWPVSSIRNSPRHPVTAIRCSPVSSVRRWSTRRYAAALSPPRRSDR